MNENPETTQVEPVASVTVLFLPDGSMATHSESLRPNHAWSAAGLLRNIGDDLFHAQQASIARARMAEQAEAESARRRILTPVPSGR